MAVKPKKINTFLVKERPPERPKKIVVKDEGPGILDMFSVSVDEENEETEAMEKAILANSKKEKIKKEKEFEDDDRFDLEDEDAFTESPLDKFYLLRNETFMYLNFKERIQWSINKFTTGEHEELNPVQENAPKENDLSNEKLDLDTMVGDMDDVGPNIS